MANSLTSKFSFSIQNGHLFRKYVKKKTTSYRSMLKMPSIMKTLSQPLTFRNFVFYAPLKNCHSVWFTEFVFIFFEESKLDVISNLFFIANKKSNEKIVAFMCVLVSLINVSAFEVITFDLTFRSEIFDESK